MAVGGVVQDPGKSFEDWLSEKLATDDPVFTVYIRGILEGEDTDTDKKLAIEDILAGLAIENITNLCEEILETWTVLINKTEKTTILEDVEVKLARLMENQAKTATISKSTCSAEQQRIKEAILQQYGQMSDEEDQEKGNEASVAVEKNTNVSSVVQAEKEKREKAKLESQRKKEKDKEDREKQKTLQQEKKEKRKTQKGERRR